MASGMPSELIDAVYSLHGGAEKHQALCPLVSWKRQSVPHGDDFCSGAQACSQGRTSYNAPPTRGSFGSRVPTCPRAATTWALRAISG